MRFLELHLLAYGPFSGRKLDLSREGPCLHLIYGPNEAGKSTTLRAVLGLLYGIEDRTSDDYVHGHANLRIAARLIGADGRELAVCRRKGRKDTLLGEDGRAVDEASLQRMLSGIPQSVFRTMFALDHERLREGGEQLRSGRGDLGESLFQAGAGAPGIHRVLAALNEEADALFLPRGQRRLNDAIKRHEQARKQVREHSQRAEGFRVQQQELEQAKLTSTALQAQRRDLLAEQSQLERALRVLPALARRRELSERRAALGPVVCLPEDAAQVRRSAQTELLASEGQAVQLRQRKQQLELRRAALVVSKPLAALSPELVRGVRNRLGNHLKAAEDLPRRRAELGVLELEVIAAQRVLGLAVPLEQIESLRIDLASETRIGKLGSEHSGLRERLAAAERDLQTADAAMQQARAELRALPPSERGAPKTTVLTLPREASVDTCRGRFDRLAQARAHAAELHAKLVEREENVLSELGVLEREGAPPIEQDLGHARAARDACWREIRAELDRPSAAPTPELAARYEPLAQRADELADRLRREAGRVSRLAQLLAERDAIARERARLDQQGMATQVEADALEREWLGLFEPLGVSPGTPAEMQALLAKVAALCATSDRGRMAAERRNDEAQRALERWQREWGGLMAKLRLAAEASVEEASAVLGQLRRLFDTVIKMGQVRARIEGMERDAETFKREVSGLAALHLPEIEGLALDLSAEQLIVRHEKARADLTQQEHIEQDLREAGSQLEALEDSAVRAHRELDSLMRSAHAHDLEALEEVERKSAQARDLDRRLVEVEDELLDHGEGAGIEALIAQTTQLSPDRVRARLVELKDELDLVNEEHTAAVHKGGNLEAGLELLKRDGQSAEAAAEAEQHLSRIKQDASSYVHKKLAAELLQREIARYRDQNQGPMVGHAGELFARLTLGRYPKLRVDYNDKDELVLKCVEQKGAAVEIETLSDGARDQLYLALRLSSLRLFAERSEPMPLLLDDVLIHFDDERAGAALQLLGEFAGVTQVFFFTHHARIVELARKAIPEPRLVEHRLA